MPRKVEPRYEKWIAAANARGMDLNEWIVEVCNEAAHGAATAADVVAEHRRARRAAGKSAL